MTTIARSDNSLLARWWWTIDRWNLTALVAMIGIGAILALAASPPVAERIGLDTYHFAHRQFVFLPLALAVILGVSMLSPRGIRRLAMVGFGGAVLLTAATLVVGAEIKGATRWLHVAGFSLQPSEFLKPAVAVVAAWMFAERRLDAHFPGYLIATGLFSLSIGLLLLQPDVGMSAVLFGTWAVQFFLAGLPLFLVVGIVILFAGGLAGAYFTFDHVRVRFDRFLDPAAGDGYQISRAMEAFKNGGFFGTGPGEGQVKSLLPDAHADFVFAVAGEEFGMVACLVVVGLFAFVVLRGFARVLKDDDLFVLLAATGLLTQFGLQAIINMSSTLHLIPPKGMTLPFMSYGGSSTLALALAMGMVLALTRQRPGRGSTP